MIAYRSVFDNGGGGTVGYDYTVKIGDNYGAPTNFANYFSDNKSMINEPMVVGDGVTNCYRMLYNSSFNAPVTIGNNVTDCSEMLYRCYSFNQSVNISDSVTNCQNMLRNCSNFNAPITIGNNVATCANMLTGCTNYNLPITIPYGVTNCSYMLYSDTSFNHPVIVPASATNCVAMLISCNSFGSDVYFEHTSYTPMLANSMFDSTNKSLRKNIHFHPSMNNVFNVTSYRNTIVSDSISWTDMEDGNGFYNTYYNIYCYNNYLVN